MEAVLRRNPRVSGADCDSGRTPLEKDSLIGYATNTYAGGGKISLENTDE